MSDSISLNNALGAIRVLMIVMNPCTHDTRVIKQAEALVRAGYDVRVLCRFRDGLLEEEIIRGVHYVRVSMDAAFHRASAQKKPGLQSGSTAASEAAGGVVPSRFRSHHTDDRPARGREGARDDVGRLLRARRAVFRALRRVLKRARQVVLAPVKKHRAARVLYSRIRDQVDSFSPDVIHAHDLKPFPAALRAAQRTQALVVYDSHELERHRNGLGAVPRLMTALAETRTIRKAAAVITVCDSIAAWLSSTYDIERPTVIMNAPDTRGPRSLSHSVRDDACSGREYPLGVYVGKLTFNRGLEEVVEAAALWPELHLALVGPANPKTVRRLKELVEEMGLLERVHFLRSVPPGDVVSYIASADFGIVPTQDACLSYRYSLPNKLFEMTFAGLPIAASDLPEQRSFLQRMGSGVLMNPRDPEDIARAMQEVYERRASLAPGADVRVVLEREYSWSAQVSKLRALYARLADERRSHQHMQVPVGS